MTENDIVEILSKYYSAHWLHRECAKAIMDKIREEEPSKTLIEHILD